MVEPQCPICGHAVAGPDPDVPRRPRRCPRCGSAVGPAADEVAGAETIFYPHLQTDPQSPQESPGAKSARPLRSPAGTFLLPDDEEPEAAAATPALGAHLVLQGASCEGPFPLTETRTVVGRVDSEITVDDPTLSSRHFEIEAKGTEFFLRDLQSSNGTLLNGYPVRSAKLDSGDEIRAGRSTFIFRILQVISID